MIYLTIVTTPVASLRKMSYERFKQLLTSCYAEIIKNEAIFKVVTSEQEVVEVTKRLRKLDASLKVLQQHVHYATFCRNADPKLLLHAA